MNHLDRSIDIFTLRKNILHFERSLAKARDRHRDIVGLSWKKRRKKVCLGMAQGYDVGRILEVLFPGKSRGDDKLFESVVGNAEDISEKHDFCGVGLTKGQSLSGFEDLIHNVWDFRALGP